MGALIKKWLLAAGGWIACRLSYHNFTTADPPRKAFGYTVFVCTSGCKGDWARERFDYQMYFFRIQGNPQRGDQNGVTYYY